MVAHPQLLLRGEPEIVAHADEAGQPHRPVGQLQVAPIPRFGSGIIRASLASGARCICPHPSSLAIALSGFRMGQFEEIVHPLPGGGQHGLGAAAGGSAAAHGCLEVQAA